MPTAVYTSAQIREWENVWFAHSDFWWLGVLINLDDNWRRLGGVGRL